MPSFEDLEARIGKLSTRATVGYAPLLPLWITSAILRGLWAIITLTKLIHRTAAFPAQANDLNPQAKV